MNTTRTKGSIEPAVIQCCGFISRLAGPLAMAVGGLVLAGWVWEIGTLKSVMTRLCHDEAEHGVLL